jgi:hypothetical protein
MKHCRVLLLAGFVSLLPVLAAEKNEDKKPAKMPAVQVTVKRISLPSGETLDEVSTTTAVIQKEVEGTLSINVGSLDQPKFWTVEFDAEEGSGSMQVSVSDSTRLRQGMREGTSWVSPVVLFQINAPFDGSGEVAIYKSKSESMTLEITPVADAARAKPEDKAKPEGE